MVDGKVRVCGGGLVDEKDDGGEDADGHGEAADDKDGGPAREASLGLGDLGGEIAVFIGRS